MSRFTCPPAYQSLLSVHDTQKAIALLKKTFEQKLTQELNLTRVSAPLFVDAASGLNDDLNGVERPVSFDILETHTEAQIVHSLAKWKRMALHRYHFPVGEGLCSDMNAIRRDEEMDNLHSIYVDQWDWEKVIDRSSRTLETLRQTVTQIVHAICDTQEILAAEYPALTPALSRDVSFITTQQLEDLYPTLSPKERENRYLQEHKTAFIMQIGDLLHSGQKHDGRAPDYDDWSLNGDILFWSDTLSCAVEISSMGIRVDATTLDQQLTKSGCEDRRQLPFHKMLLEDRLPLTIGGGIGQSRLCLLLLHKVHIGEVQVSLWDDDTQKQALAAGVPLL